MARAKSSDGRIDALFALPLGDFVRARNALATELAEAGDSDAALRVRTLAKPSVSAWLVNQLYRKHSGAFDTLLEAGRRMRKGQRALMAGGSADALKDATKAEQKALAKLAGLAGSVLGEARLPATHTTLDRAQTTLRAIARLEDPESVAGQLTRDLEPAGFDALIGSQAEPSAPLSARAPAKRKDAEPRRKQKKVEKSQEREQRAAQKRLVERARRAEKALVRDAKRAERSTVAAAKLLARAKKDLAESERRHERAQIRHEAAKRSAAEAAELERSLAERLAETKRQLEAAHALERRAGKG
jgi:hypothetical protein